MKPSQTKMSTLALLAALTLLSVQALAQCGSADHFKAKLKNQAWRNYSFGSATLMNISDGTDSNSVVGMWRFTFTSKGNNVAPLFIPDGAVLDHGFAQWHSDGTEITNSNRLPSTGSFCLGVWKKVGPNHYKLNHFALGFDDTVHENYTNIREDLILSDDGNSFTGSFVIAIYDLQGNAGPVITGDLTGTRVNLNTTVQDIL